MDERRWNVEQLVLFEMQFCNLKENFQLQKKLNDLKVLMDLSKVKNLSFSFHIIFRILLTGAKAET